MAEQLNGVSEHWRIHWGVGVAPLAAWASAQNALKVTIFRLKIEKKFWEGAIPPPQTAASFSLHSLNHNVVSNTLVLSPRAICIHTTACFPTSNGFWHLKRFKQSMEEWTTNCKNSAQNALKVAIFRLKIEKKFWGVAMPSPQTPASFSLHSLNHNVVSNTLVLSPRAICIHTTARFPTNNGFWRL